MATPWDKHSVHHRVPSVNHPAAILHRNYRTSLINTFAVKQITTSQQRRHTSLAPFFATHITGMRTLTDP